MLTAAASWILFSLAVLVWHGGHFQPGTYLPVFFMAFVMALAMILGSLSSQAERNLRVRLTETVSNLRMVQGAQEKQLQKLTETHMLLEERYAETYALYLIEQEIAAELEVDKILPKVADIVLGLLGGRSCSIMLADRDQACLRQAAVSGSCRGGLVFPLGGNPLARSWAENVPLSHADLSEEERAFWNKRGANGLLCLPISTKSERVGLILVEYDHLPQSLDDHRDLLSLVAGQLSLALENAYLYRKVSLMATHDALTGLSNRYYFQERLTTELESASTAHPLAAILVDVDHFKTVNDEFGHQIGDDVLRFLADLLVEEVGQEGTVARYGGEEFVVLLAGIALERAVQVAERIRARVAASTYQGAENRIEITVSLGVAAYPCHAKDRRSLLGLANHALYLAKQERDKVVVAETQSQRSGGLSRAVSFSLFARMPTSRATQGTGRI